MTFRREELEGHWRPMVRVARSVLGDRDEAEECAAAAILQVLERGPQDVQNLEAFMVTVAKRRAVDRLRRLDRARRRERLASQLLPVEDVAEDVVARAEARWMRQEARLRLNEQSYRILQAVADGEDMKVIAARERLTVRAAHSDLFRSRRLLRAVWARTLAILAGLWAMVRRGTVAAPAMAAAATLLTILPSVTPHQPPDSAGDRPKVEFAPGATAYVVTVYPQDGSSVTKPGPAVNVRPREQTRRPGSQRSRTVLIEAADPAGRTTVTRERHGEGPDAGPAGTVFECVEALRLDPHNLGC